MLKPKKEKPGKMSDSVNTKTGKDKVSYNVGRKTGRVSQLSATLCLRSVAGHVNFLVVNGLLPRSFACDHLLERLALSLSLVCWISLAC